MSADHVHFNGDVNLADAFEDLVPLCERAGQWSFLCVIAPLRLPRATGSPVNPIAMV